LQAIGMAAQRSGTAMQVEGRLIIVDAPCSGVQMVWMAYFCACAVAAFKVTHDSRFVRRLPWVGVLVLCGNVLRNSVLVVLEARLDSVPEVVHQGVGLAVLAGVCAAVVALVRGGGDARI
jgi:exosortase/archaeosortase family protein